MPVHQNGLVVVVRQDTNQYIGFTSTQAASVRKLDVFPFRQVQLLNISARFPNKIVVNLEARNPEQSGIYILDLLSSNLKRIGQMEDFGELFFDENFTIIAGWRPNELGGNSLLRRVEGEWVHIFRHDFEPDMFLGGLSRIISITSDGKTIFATDYTEKDKTSLVSIETATGKVTELASDSDADILPWGASFDPKGKPTSVVALWGDTKRHVVDPAVQKDFDFLNKELGGNVAFAGSSADGKIWLVRKFDGAPTSYYFYERESQKLSFLFTDHSYLEGYDLPTRKAFTVTTRDSLRLPVHVYLPFGMARSDGSAKTPLPTIIYIHGGPWAGVTHWNNWLHTRNFQLLANRGYAVINMEFRGTTGLGKKLTAAGDQQWGAAMHNDIVDVTNWAIKQGIANRKRIGIWGWSYGGYAANYALAASPDIFACGISMYGLSDLEAFCKIPFASNDHWQNRVGNVNTSEGAELLKKHSPLTYVEQIKSPLLLTTGSLDERVPQEQSDRFAEALEAAGKEVIYFVYPEEVHDYRQAESWISFWAIAEHFLHHNLGGRKESRKHDIEKGKLRVVFGEEYISEIE